MMRWSVLLPYYNESRYLANTLESLVAQTLRPLHIVLVDNGSTDQSAALAREVMRCHPDVITTHLREPRPGKVTALATGLAAVDTPFVATCDADTWYPPQYLERCDRMFADGGVECMAVLACHIHDAPHSEAALRQRQKILRKAQMFPRNCHAGGYAQAFRTGALREVGGFDEAIWPYVLLDHEIIHRLLKRGRTAYSLDHWCLASDRRTDRRRVAWTPTERWLYRHLPFVLKDWFFYRFLAKRFAARGMFNTRLREHAWDAAPAGTRTGAPA